MGTTFFGKGRTQQYEGDGNVSRVVVMGQGYVGLPMAMRAVEVGHVVVGYEPDRNRLAALQSGASYVEDVSSESLQAALASGRRPGPRRGDGAGRQRLLAGQSRISGRGD